MNEIKYLMNYLWIYNVIFISLIKLSNNGKTKILNWIIGKVILPMGMEGWTKMRIFIGYSDTGKYVKRADFIKKISIKNVFIYSQNRLFLIWDNMNENLII